MARRPPLRPQTRARGINALGRMLQFGESLTRAATHEHVSPNVVRRVGRETGALRKVEGRWSVRPRADATFRRGILTDEGWTGIRVVSTSDADLLRDYAHAVRTRDREALAKFRGKTVTDYRGRTHRLITDRRALARLDRADELEPPDWAFGSP